MGYAFLYGVFGSLLGSNLGAFLYARMIEPVLGTAAVAGRARIFWLLFTVLDVCAAGALVLFARRFGADTPATRRSAARAMTFIYGLIAVLGAAFLVAGVLAAPIQVRTVVQALIFLALGAGGIVVIRRGRDVEGAASA
jgi:hypothetical protein